MVHQTKHSAIGKHCNSKLAILLQQYLNSVAKKQLKTKKKIMDAYFLGTVTSSDPSSNSTPGFALFLSSCSMFQELQPLLRNLTVTLLSSLTE